jgi:hypothetical protein
MRLRADCMDAVAAERATTAMLSLNRWRRYFSARCTACRGTGGKLGVDAAQLRHTCVSVISASRAAFCAATCCVSFSIAMLSCCNLPSS